MSTEQAMKKRVVRETRYAILDLYLQYHRNLISSSELKNELESILDEFGKEYSNIHELAKRPDSKLGGNHEAG